MTDFQLFCRVLGFLGILFLVFLAIAHWITRDRSMKGKKYTRYQQIIMRENGEKARRTLDLIRNGKAHDYLNK